MPRRGVGPPQLRCHPQPWSAPCEPAGRGGGRWVACASVTVRLTTHQECAAGHHVRMGITRLPLGPASSPRPPVPEAACCCACLCRSSLPRCACTGCEARWCQALGCPACRRLMATTADAASTWACDANNRAPAELARRMRWRGVWRARCRSVAGRGQVEGEGACVCDAVAGVSVS